jgi:hypothetical protein
MRKILLTLFAAGFLGVAITPAAAENYLDGEIIVEFADGVDLEPPPGVPDGRYPELDALGELYGVYESVPVFDLPTEQVDHPSGLWTWEDWEYSVDERRLPYFVVLYYSSDQDPVAVAADYAECELVEYAAPDYIGECYYHPNDTHYSDQWYLYYSQNRSCDIHAPEGWNLFIYAQEPTKRGKRSEDGYKPVIGVPDSGIWMSQPSYNYVHADIKANVKPGKDIIDQDEFPEDIYGQGTAVAGIVAAVWNNNYGIAGIGKNDTRVLPVRITHDYGEHPLLAEKAAAGGIVCCAEKGADVINMSWGFSAGVIPRTVQRAIEHVWHLDINTTAATGNTGGELKTYPAWEGRWLMISAAGTKRVPSGWARWEGSSWPTNGAKIAAPASPNIYVTWLNNGYKGDEFGTSYSCAMVSGTVAGYRHMLASFGDPYPGIDSDAVLCVEESGADYPYSTKETGYGTTYYDDGLNYAIEIRPGGDGGGQPSLSAAAPAISAAAVFPNPAKAKATLRLDVPGTNVTEARVVVYDISGRKVRAFTAPVKGGSAEAVWDLADGSGARVPPGVYIWRVEVGPASAAKKCIVN